MLTATELLAQVAPSWRPPPKRTVSQWADEKRMLSPEGSALPGRWDTKIVEYAREIMDCVSDPRVTDIAWMACSQVGKSEVLLNIQGYLMDYDPSPILMVQPTVEMAQAFSKDRIAPMIRDTPALRKIVSEAKSREATNTIQQKMFPGGHLTMIGANAPAGLASRPIRAVLFDEVDRYPPSAGSEGDPIKLAEKRTVTFWNRIKIKVSTPVNKSDSRIEMAYGLGDMRQWHVPCPHCGYHQVLVWANVKWTDRDASSARYQCDECGVLWTDNERVAAVRKGHWKPQREFNGVASFHTTGLMSPFVTLEEGVQEFLDAQGNPLLLKVWTNTYLGETWEEEGQRVDHHTLRERCEDWPGDIEDGVTLLTAGVDVQDNRLEYEIVGWGNDDESWSVKYGVIYGDPSGPAIWLELKAALFQIFEHPRFGQISVRAACVDTGYLTSKVLKFCRATERVYAIKGIGGEGKPLTGNPSKSNFASVPVFPVGTHTAKDLVFGRLRASSDEAGYCHFPNDNAHGDEYFKQLTGEELRTRFHKGFAKKEYVKIRNRNEALDCRVYATAALDLLDVDLAAQRRAVEAQWEQWMAEQNAPETKPKSSGRPLKTGFVNQWRNR